MSTFSEYYSNLLAWEEQPHQELIARWDTSHIAAIQEDFRSAVATSNIKELLFVIREGSSSQSIGNQAEMFFVANVNSHLAKHEIALCSGPGYPDRMLRVKGSTAVFPFEVKATSKWNPLDSNRCVLTSSSEKLRRYFQKPICHLLATISYVNTHPTRVTGVRLDSLQPDSKVNVRLEASVSQRLLSRGDHPWVQL